ncbi:MAG TPA: PaaI family thioesterase [Verrucomicrobiae bacterium]|nr:PaaI family thioesterase [Verrucomicrobiae bacterium]
MENIKSYFKGDQFANRCGIELLSISTGHATAKMPVHPHHLNSYKTVQGGAIFTLADYTFAAAANSHGTVAVAINASITFMKAAQSGTLWAEAKEISKNFKIGTYSVEIKDDDGDLVAQFQGLAYRKQEKLP